LDLKLFVVKIGVIAITNQMVVVVIVVLDLLIFVVVKS